MRDKPLILVVDDEESFLEILSTKLAVAGFEVAIAKSGAEGVKNTETLMPDLVLMDIKMPGETGTDAALTIKQNPKTKDTKIAFLTNLKDPWPAVSADRQKLSKALGMEDFLEKTDDLDTIIEKVRQILARK